MSRISSQEKVNNRISQDKPKMPKRMIIISIVSVCVIAGIVAYVMLGLKPKPVESDSYNMVVTPENVDELLTQMRSGEKAAIGTYQVNMNTEWTFPNSSAPAADAIIGNSLANSNPVFFTIALADNEKQIYKSPLIPVGSSLNNIVLDSKLDAGSYDCVLTYHLLDDKGKETSTTSVNMTITIQK